LCLRDRRDRTGNQARTGKEGSSQVSPLVCERVRVFVFILRRRRRIQVYGHAWKNRDREPGDASCRPTDMQGSTWLLHRPVRGEESVAAGLSSARCEAAHGGRGACHRQVVASNHVRIIGAESSRSAQRAGTSPFEDRRVIWAPTL